MPVLLKKITFLLDRHDATNSRDFLETKLLTHITENNGGTRIAIAFANDSDDVVEADLGESLAAEFKPQNFRELVCDPAVVGYQIEAVAPFKRPSRFPERRRA